MKQPCKLIALSLALSVLAGCDWMLVQDRPPPELLAPAPVAPAARTAEAFDTTTAAERAAALAPPATATAALGKVVVTLGAPAEPGFWLRSSLVSAERAGRVETSGGASAAVTLLPGEGAAQLSLAAFRALGLSLTDLPQVTVYGG